MQRSDHYDMLGELAVGGMATVYLGQTRRRSGQKRLVAIKSMRPDLAEDEAFSAMFLDEATLTARIKHPNVVRTLDVVSADGHLLIVMEYVEGVSLSRLLELVWARGAALPPSVSVAIMCDVLRGLHAAHQLVDDNGRPLNVVHRDVSPQNVLVGTDGVARILDFGIAKAASQRHVTALGEIKGKLAYMPPEQQVAEPVDRRADVYAAGVVLWEMIASRRLFDSESEDELVRQVFEGRIDPPSRFSATPISPELDRVVLRALSRKREDRWWSAEEMANALSAAIEPVSRNATSAILHQFVTLDLDERSRLIDDLLEHHVSNTSVLEPEAQAVLDVLSTGPRPRPIAESDPLLVEPGEVSTAQRRSHRSRRRSQRRTRTLIAFAFLGIVVGLLAVIALAVWTKDDPGDPEPVWPPAPPIPATDDDGPRIAPQIPPNAGTDIAPPPQVVPPPVPPAQSLPPNPRPRPRRK